MIKINGDHLEVKGIGAEVACEIAGGLIQMLEVKEIREVVKENLELLGADVDVAEREFLKDLADLIAKHENVFIEEERKENGDKE